MERVINDYMSRELAQDPTLLPSANVTPQPEIGVLNSATLLRPMIFVQGRFRAVVDDVSLVCEHFAEVDARRSLLSRAGGRSGQAGDHR